MRVSIVKMLLVLTAALVFGLAAYAGGGEKGDVEIGAYGGYAWPDTYRVSPKDDTLVGVRLGWFVSPKWSLELSGQQFSTELTGLPNTEFEIESIRLNALHNFRSGERFRPFLTFGVGSEGLDIEPTLDRDDPGVNVGGGLRWYLSDNFGFRLDHRFVFTDVGGPVDDQQFNMEVAAGLLLSFGGSKPGDADGDGVNDRKDRCPDTPRDAVVDERGCPLDGDSDGVFDGLDKCPTTAPGVPVDADGCDRDSDGDNVHDGLDKCPNTPRGAQVDAAGCPRDADGDGVWDGLDTCPNTPAGASVDAKGCPGDTDGDGVFDGIDKCSGTPKGAKVDATGCPTDADGDGVWDGIDRCPDTPRGTKVDVRGCAELFEKDSTTVVLEGVNFELDKATLTPNATTILDGVAATLKEWPEIRIEVSGHTDSQGAADYNQGLSQRRAEAVVKYLSGKGVSATRMTAKGYGESSPVGDNATQEGRAANRRVELKKLN